MDKMPFDVYDFFGHLFSGALLLLTFAYLVQNEWPVKFDPSLAEGSFWVMMSYIVGNVNAHFSAWLLEAKLVKAIGAPEEVLFMAKGRKWFRNYGRALPESIIGQINKKYERLAQTKEHGEAKYLFCYHAVKEECPQTLLRTNRFLNLYGFSRNISFAFGIIGLMLVCAFFFGGLNVDILALSIGSFAASVIFFFRYLKFYHEHHEEVFMSFLTGVKKTRSAY